MDIKYNNLDLIISSNVYLAKPNQTIIGALNGINKDSFKYSENLKDFDEIEFDVYKYINIDEKLVKSNCYDKLNFMMDIYVDNVGKFIITTPPSVMNDDIEYKHIVAKSAEWEFLSKDLINFKINTGEDTSIERLIKNNVDDYGITKEYITFYNEDNTSLSLLHILLNKVNRWGTWNVGYVSDSIKDATLYFDIDNVNIYTFMTQNISKELHCIFKFDTKNKLVNVYSEDEIGEYTNVFISRRNLAKKINIEPSTESIYTRYTVRGSDDLEISRVNFGSDKIEDLSYFLNTDYLPSSTIDGYKRYISEKESRRDDWINIIKEQVSLIEEKNKIINQVPVESLNYDWDSFTLEELNEQLVYFQGLVDVIESSYTTQEELEASSDYWDWHSYTTYIIPNIEKAIENKENKDDSEYTPKEYDDGWKTNWKLYGLDELKAQSKLYKNQDDVLKDWRKSWNDLTDDEKKEKFPSEDTYNINHNLYVKANTNLRAINSRIETLESEVSALQTQIDNKQESLNAIAEQVNISNFLSDKELKIIESLYIDTDYVNDNFNVTSIMNSSEKIDRMLELLKYAKDDIAKSCRPQYSFSIEIHNLFAIPEFRPISDKFRIGNFIRIADDDITSEIVRISSITYNPLLPNDDNLTVSFTNMMTWNNQRNDFTDLFDNAISHSKNSISRKNYSTAKDDVELTNELIRYILNSRQADDLVTNTVIKSVAESNSQANISIVNNDIVITGDMIKLNGDTTVEDDFILSADNIDVDNLVVKKGNFTESFNVDINWEIDVADTKEYFKTFIEANETDGIGIGTTTVDENGNVVVPDDPDAIDYTASIYFHNGDINAYAGNSIKFYCSNGIDLSCGDGAGEVTVDGKRILTEDDIGASVDASEWLDAEATDNVYADDSFLHYKKCGDVIYLHGTFRPSATFVPNPDEPLIIFTLPQEYAPKYPIGKWVTFTPSTYWRMNIDTDGKVYFCDCLDTSNTTITVSPVLFYIDEVYMK